MHVRWSELRFKFSAIQRNNCNKVFELYERTGEFLDDEF